MGKEWDRYKQGRLKDYNTQPGGKIGSNPGEGANFGDRMAAMPNVANQRANAKCFNCGRYKWGHKTGDSGGGGKKCECDNPTFPVDNSTRETFISFLTAIMAEALRVLKPGGHAFVWALPRTSHWTGIALEDAGFEIRDVVTHLFGSGFPKSANISKAIDKSAGKEREVVGQRDTLTGANKNTNTFMASPRLMPVTAPATPEASQWNGWGTALKPASENWYLARKPLSESSIAANVLKWGTGAINIDKCRVSHDEPLKPMKAQVHVNSIIQQSGRYEATTELKENGRWPANLLLSHSVWCVPNGVKKVKGNGGVRPDKPIITDNSGIRDHGWGFGPRVGQAYNDSEGMEQVEDWLCDESCPIRLLDEQSGMRKSGGKERMTTIGYGQDSNHTFDRVVNHEASEGGASRYFMRFAYIPKASRAERNRGIVTKVDDALVPDFEEGLSEGYVRNNVTTHNGTGNYRGIDKKPLSIAANTHPTVKPVQLMRYLVRMITPPGGIVLDCFAGSGSTLVAAIHEGMHFIGIEMNDSEQEPYVSISRARIEQAFREVQS